MRMVWYKYLCAVVIVVVTASSLSYAERVDLLQALEDGQVWVQFRGWGSGAIRGTVGRSPYGPQQLSISPGTQFQAQRRGTQGMMTLGSTSIDLRNRSVAQVVVATVCTNLGRRTPTAADVFVPTRQSNSRLAQVAAAIARRRPPSPAAQLAVWAVTDNPPREEVEPFLRDVVRATRTPPQFEKRRLLQIASELLRAAHLTPSQFRMFR